MLIMKQNRKDVRVTTDNDRVIINTIGGELPRSAKAYWDLYKFLMSLDTYELMVLIPVYKQRIKNCNTEHELKTLRGHIQLIEDTYKIRARNRGRDARSSQYIMDEACIEGKQMLSILGYNSVFIYYEELDSIVDVLRKETILLEKCMYDEYTYASVLVSEIFKHYDVIFDENKIIDIYDISEKDYYNLRIILSRWLDGNYWIG